MVVAIAQNEVLLSALKLLKLTAWSKVEYLLFVLNTKTRLARDFKTGCAQGCPLTATYLLLQACESENRLWYCNTATLK